MLDVIARLLLSAGILAAAAHLPALPLPAALLAPMAGAPAGAAPACPVRHDLAAPGCIA